jgi:hypothetical protein
MCSENREMALQQMQHMLETKDMELARLHQAQTRLTSEVGELRRVARREGVNMDYLKNIVLQYMVFPVASDERQQLVPVLATLLQFNPKEVAEVEKSAQEAAWLISNPRQVIEIKRSLKNASRSAGTATSPYEEDSVLTVPRLR